MVARLELNAITRTSLITNAMVPHISQISHLGASTIRDLQSPNAFRLRNLLMIRRGYSVLGTITASVKKDNEPVAAQCSVGLHECQGMPRQTQ